MEQQVITLALAAVLVAVIALSFLLERRKGRAGGDGAATRGAQAALSAEDALREMKSYLGVNDGVDGGGIVQALDLAPLQLVSSAVRPRNGKEGEDKGRR